MGNSNLLSLVAIGQLLLLCTACGDQGTEVTKAQYGDEWPFPGFDKAIIRCERRAFGSVQRPLVTVDLGGRTYGLNGAAHGVGGYPDARTKMARHPELGHYQLGAASEFIRMGLELCK